MIEILDRRDVELAVRETALDLDVVEPGWYHRVDPDRLRMSSLTDCVLGSVFGDYTEGLRRLGAHRVDVPAADRWYETHVRAHVRATGSDVPVALWRAEVSGRHARDRASDRRVASLRAQLDLLTDDREYLAVTA